MRRPLRIGRFLLPILLLAAGNASPTTVRLQTALGVVDIALYDAAAPLTVANFLKYVNTGAYDNSFIHRSVPGFVVQGGGFTWNSATNGAASVVTLPPVANEFSPSRSNKRATVAMAKLGGDPNSATSQWFVNLADNSGNLDTQNGGFTVFGRVIADGMAVADRIAALPWVNAGGAFTNLPLVSVPAGGKILREHLVMIERASASAADASDSDRVFSYLEAAYPQYLAPAYPLSPAASFSGHALGYYYRYYPGTNAYVGTAGGDLYYLGPASGGQLLPLGALSGWVGTAISAGY